MIAMLKPDVVLMDADMPGMDGFETTVEVMTKAAMLIIIVSASEEAGHADKAFRAMEAGAVALVALPSGFGEPRARREAEIVQTVRAMSEVRVVRRRRRAAAPQAPPPAAAAVVPASRGPIDLIAIGASTGGPQTLQRLLAGLPRDLSAAVVVVQHITPNFDEFVDWLAEATGLPVCLGQDRSCCAAPRCTWRLTRSRWASTVNGASSCATTRRTACGLRSRICSARWPQPGRGAPPPCCSPAWARTVRGS